MKVVNGLGGSLGQRSLGQGALPLIASFLLCAFSFLFALPCVSFPALLSLSFSLVPPSLYISVPFRFVPVFALLSFFFSFSSSSPPFLFFFVSVSPPSRLFRHIRRVVSSSLRSRSLVEVEE